MMLNMRLVCGLLPGFSRNWLGKDVKWWREGREDLPKKMRSGHLVGGQLSSFPAISLILIQDTSVQTKVHSGRIKLPKFYVFPIQSRFSMWRLFFQNYLSSSFLTLCATEYSKAILCRNPNWNMTEGARLQNSTTCKLENSMSPSVECRPYCSFICRFSFVNIPSMQCTSLKFKKETRLSEMNKHRG